MIDNITDTINSMSALNVALTLFIPSLMGLAAAIAKYLPPPEAPGFAAKVHRAINWLGQNSGYAENKQ